MKNISEKSTDTVREYFKKWPRFYRLIGYVFGPVLLYGMGPKKFLKTYFTKEGEKNIISVGSGPMRLRQDVKNYDITPYQEVDVVADITALPIADNCVDGFICDNVLEHVEDPRKAVSELYRVLKPGAIGYVSTPFLYPFHASPYDYQRWTALGLQKLFSEFSSVEVKARSGIFSTLNVWLCYVLPTFFSAGSDRMYWVLVNISLFLFFPVKLLDLLVIHFKFSTHTAAVFYCIVKK
jgi:SAM-dependent methyltransferase